MLNLREKLKEVNWFWFSQRGEGFLAAHPDAVPDQLHADFTGAGKEAAQFLAQHVGTDGIELSFEGAKQPVVLRHCLSDGRGPLVLSFDPLDYRALLAEYSLTVQPPIVSKQK